MNIRLPIQSRHLLICLLFCLACGEITAQERQDKIQLVSMREDIRIDSLFARRTQLLQADSNTRMVDRELAKMGIKFPVKVSLINYNDKVNLSFFLLEEYDPEMISQKIDDIKRDYLGLEYIGVDVAKNKCYLTFKKNSPEWKIQSLLEEFLYDGFYIQAVSENN